MYIHTIHTYVHTYGYIHTSYIHIHTHTYSVHTYIITDGIYFLVINVNYKHTYISVVGWALGKNDTKVKTVDTDKVNLFPKPLPD